MRKKNDPAEAALIKTYLDEHIQKYVLPASIALLHLTSEQLEEAWGLLGRLLWVFGDNPAVNETDHILHIAGVKAPAGCGRLVRAL